MRSGRERFSVPIILIKYFRKFLMTPESRVVAECFQHPVVSGNHVDRATGVVIRKTDHGRDSECIGEFVSLSPFLKRRFSIEVRCHHPREVYAGKRDRLSIASHAESLPGLHNAFNQLFLIYLKVDPSQLLIFIANQAYDVAVQCSLDLCCVLFRGLAKLICNFVLDDFRDY